MADTRIAAGRQRPSAAGTLGRQLARSLPGRADMRLALPVTLYLIGVLTPIYFNIGPIALSTMRVVLLVYFIPFAVLVYTGQRGRLNLADIFLPLHAFWTFLSIAVLNPDRVLQFVGSTTLEFFGGYLVARACIRGPDDFVRLTKVLAWTIILVLMPLALFETLTARPILVELLAKVPGIFTVENVIMPDRLGFDRAQTLLSHPIHHGFFCSIAFSLVYVGLRDEIPDTRRFIMAALVAFTTFWSLSSGAILALAMQFGMILYYRVTRTIPRRWLLLTLIFVAAYVVVDLISTRSAMRVFMTYATFSPYNAYWRAEIFKWGMHNVWLNPVFGIGMANWIRPSWMFSPSVDNYWLLLAMRHGIPAFVLMAIAVLGSMYAVARRDFSADPRLNRLRRAWLFNMVGLIFTLATVHIWTAAMSFYFFVVGAGMWMIDARAQTEEEQPEARDMTAPLRAQKTPYSRPRRAKGKAQPRRYSRKSGAGSTEASRARPDRS